MLRRILALGAMAALASCQGAVLPCPAAKILRDASQVTRFAPAGQGTAPAVQYTGQITQAKLACAYDPNTQERLEVNLGIEIEAQRNPAARVETADFRYFVAIVNLQGELLARQEFPLRLSFDPGQDSVRKVEEIFQVIPLTYPQNGGSLQIWTGFQLSPAELDYNRGRRTS